MSDRADKYVCGLDVGTTKVCAVMGQVDVAGNLAITGVGVVPAAGMKRGIVVDRELAAGAIAAAVSKVSTSCGTPIASVYLGITGSHISCVNVRGRAYINGPQVAQSDVEQAIASACDSVPLTSDRRILQQTVRDFVLDGERGIKRPLGMVGRQLDVNLHVVTGRGSIVDNLVGCVEDAGVSVAGTVLEAQATAAAVLTDAEQRLGCVLLDIGGGTADLAVFTEGAICHTSAVPMAGNQVTMDIAKVLRVAPEEAERIKRSLGHAMADEVAEEQGIEVTLVGTDDKKLVQRRLLAEIIQARMEEILEAVAEKLTTERLWALAPAGVVLSGGGSELPGMARLATATLRGLPARVGSPRDLKGHSELVAEPMYATGAGLARLAAADEAWCTQRRAKVTRRTGVARSLLSRAWQRFLELWHRFHALRR